MVGSSTRSSQAWSQDQSPLPQYPAGSSGPQEADALHEDLEWRPL